MVSRDNFGPNVAQVAGAALLISYTITVAVSVAAGTDAIISAVPALSGAQLPLSIAFVVLLAYGNLRGIREAGPTLRHPDLLLHSQHGSADHRRSCRERHRGISAMLPAPPARSSLGHSSGGLHPRHLGVLTSFERSPTAVRR